MTWALTIYRILYGGFYLAVSAWAIIALTTGALDMPSQDDPGAQATKDVLNDAGYMPLALLSFITGGLALLFNRTAPLGVILLTPSVLGIFVFHLTQTGNIIWGTGWLIGLAVLAFAYRDRFKGLFTHT